MLLAASGKTFHRARSPLAATRRRCREESGYLSNGWRALGRLAGAKVGCAVRLRRDDLHVFARRELVTAKGGEGIR